MKIEGTIDLLFVNKKLKKVLIVDYKFGKIKVPEKSNQLVLYGLLVLENFFTGKYGDARVWAEIIQPEFWMDFDFNKKKEKEFLEPADFKTILDYIKKLKKSDKQNLKSLEQRTDWCEFKTCRFFCQSYKKSNENLSGVLCQ